MRIHSKCCFVMLATLSAWGCQTGDPMQGFIARMDSAPPEHRVPKWDFVKGQMLRIAPAVGDTAPEFSLPTLSGDGTVTRSKHHLSKPQVLVFGSFT